MVARSLTTAAAITSTRNTAETMRTGLSSCLARAGRLGADSMPMLTGTSTMAKTWSTLSNCSGMALPSPMKAVEREVDDEGQGQQREQAVDGGEGDVQRDVAAGEVAEEVGRGAAGRGREQHQADGELGRQGEADGDAVADAGSSSIWQTRPTITARGYTTTRRSRRGSARGRARA
jgi:hypothetical protein